MGQGLQLREGVDLRLELRNGGSGSGGVDHLDLQVLPFISRQVVPGLGVDVVSTIAGVAGEDH